MASGNYLSLVFGDMDIEASENCRSGFLLLFSDSTSYGKDILDSLIVEIIKQESLY